MCLVFSKKNMMLLPQKTVLKGLVKLRHYIPDLIIADIMMPRMDGYQFCKTVKSNPALKHIPLIFLTAKADAACKIEGLDEGADDYIVKPFNAQELLARIRAHLRIKSLVKETAVKEKEIAHLKEVVKQKASLPCYYRQEQSYAGNLQTS